MRRRFSRFVSVGLGNVCTFACYFSNLHETTLFLRFLCMCFISTQTNKQTAVDVKHWKRNTAVDVTLTAFRCTSFRSACCFVVLVFVLFVAECETQTDKRQLMSLKQTRNGSSRDVKHRTVDVDFGFCVQARREGIHCNDVTTHVLTRDIKDV